MSIDVDSFRVAVLAWYDVHGRAGLPWRGAHMDPYRVWLAEVMLQQTTVAAAAPYFESFTARWPTVHALAAAPREDVMAAWAGLGYYARARNMHACAQAVSAAGGAFPSDEGALRALPGVGAYTAAAVRAFAFGLPATVVDANVERVVARLFAVREPLPAGKPAIKRHARALSEGRADRPGDFAAAIMDLGATVCTPRAPRCGACPLPDMCAARAQGVEAALPARAPKQAKPHRRGHVYYVEGGGGRILFCTRPEGGLLGGMLALPSSNWGETPTHPPFLEVLGAPLEAEVRHVFTHFTLALTPWRAWLVGPLPAGHHWAAPEAEALPTVFRKALELFT